MNATTKIARPTKPVGTPRDRVLPVGTETLKELAADAEGLRRALEALRDVADPTNKPAVERLITQLNAMEPSVTLIGQVKAGKTSLVNAMAGRPGLLPADVNPWTSVVTSLHMNPPGLKDSTAASFRFFDDDEWDRLVTKGGRLGELSERAGADDETEKVREQVQEMRDKSRARLGHRFELLMGQEHTYGYFDEDLIERYVCLGDDIELMDTSDDRGQFADITKSADLSMSEPIFPVPFCLRDTPGVNDTFMMREQITINAIRDSRLCVVVLSAHQAMSSVDLGLIRLIANLKSRDVVIFVNRIDELRDPANDVPEIANSIRETLRRHHGPTDAELIFGSAYWAEHVLKGKLSKLAPDSAAALMNWAKAQRIKQGQAPGAEGLVWDLSGLPALYRILSERIADGAGRDALEAVCRSALNIAQGMKTADQLVALRSDSQAPIPIEAAKIGAEIKNLKSLCLSSLEDAMDRSSEMFCARIDRSHQSFLDRAVAALLEHIEAQGDTVEWHYDPTGLRLLLRSAHQVLSSQTDTVFRKVMASTSDDIAALYERLVGTNLEGLSIETPDPPQISAPVDIGQTIALDLKGNWWSRWWKRRRGLDRHSEEFAKLISAETLPMVEDLKATHLATIKAAVMQRAEAFLDEQAEILNNLADKSDVSFDDVDAIFGIKARAERQKVLDGVVAVLNDAVV